MCVASPALHLVNPNRVVMCEKSSNTTIYSAFYVLTLTCIGTAVLCNVLSSNEGSRHLTIRGNESRVIGEKESDHERKGKIRGGR